jgi:hypothetical protein
VLASRGPSHRPAVGILACRTSEDTAESGEECFWISRQLRFGRQCASWRNRYLPCRS